MSEYKLLPDGSVVPIIDAPSNVNSNGPGAEGNRQDEKEAGSLALQPVEPPQCRWPKCDCEIPKCWQPAPPPAAVPAQPAEPHPWADLDHPMNRIDEGAQPADRAEPAPLTDAQLMRAFNSVRGSSGSPLTVERWKDGIDLDEPTHFFRELAAAILATRSQP